MIKKILNYLRLKAKMESRMVAINETMALREVCDVYAKYNCKKNGWPKYTPNGWLRGEFCEISLAFMNGYSKALHDNGFEFQNGLVKKRDITHEMPCGALDYYRKDAISETKDKAIEALQRVMEKYETSKANINIIMNAFKEEIKED